MESPFSLRLQNLSLESLPRRHGFIILTATAKTPPWNDFHGVEVSLSSLQPTKSLRGITSTASRFHYLHCGRPNPFVESLPQRHGFTILTATDQTPWVHLHSTTHWLFSLQPPNNPPWNHFHSAMNPLPRIFLLETEFVQLAAAATFPPAPYSPVNCRVLTGRPTYFSIMPNSTPFPQPHQGLPLLTCTSPPWTKP